MLSLRVFLLCCFLAFQAPGDRNALSKEVVKNMLLNKRQLIPCKFSFQLPRYHLGYKYKLLVG